MPCLNEADTVERCVQKALRGIAGAGVVGEVLVADNGSTDGSIELAQKAGARVVPVSNKGYGHALRAGIAAAKGEWVLMGDADDSYDFLEIPKFVNRMNSETDLVQGCRLPGGGGTVAEGAMPWSHRWIGNPTLTALVRLWFHAPIHDVYCGMRAFRKSFYESLDQRCTGMEFATEMIIKASLFQGRIAEVPITLHKDGRIAHPPHLRTMRDGWRTLRFFLLYSPRWLFLIPGLLLMALGLLGYALALPGVSLGGITFDAHTLLFASLFVLCGFQAVVFSVFTMTFAIEEGLLPRTRSYGRIFEIFRLERGIIAGLLLGIAGTFLLGISVWQWYKVDFGRLDYASTMRLVIPGATLAGLGFQTILSSFLVSVLGLKRR